jgi:hypothetical protein
MEQPKGPITSVAFAPTEAFLRAYPKEGVEQTKKFKTPSWHDRMEEERVTATVQKAQEVIDNDEAQLRKLHEAHASKANPLLAEGEAVEEEGIPKVYLALALLATLFLLGVAAGWQLSHVAQIQ